MGEERAGFVGRVRGETDGNAAAGRNLPQDRHGLKGKVAFQGPLSLDGPAGGREGNQTVIHDLERDHLARFLHTGENVIHIADGTGGELIGDPVEVQAGTADQYLHAAVKQGLEVLGHLLIPGGQFYAGIHEQDGAGEIVGLDQRIEKHPHEIGAELPVTVANDVPAHKDGVAGRGSGRADRLLRRGNRQGTIFQKGQAVSPVLLLHRGVKTLVRGKTLEVSNGSGIVHQNGELTLARGDGLLGHEHRHGTGLSLGVNDTRHSKISFKWFLFVKNIIDLKRETVNWSGTAGGEESGFLPEKPDWRGALSGKIEGYDPFIKKNNIRSRLY